VEPTHPICTQINTSGNASLQAGEIIDEVLALSHLGQLTLIIFFVIIEISKPGGHWIETSLS
jgi:hypothetical protein